jgi:hypothetical protein
MPSSERPKSVEALDPESRAVFDRFSALAASLPESSDFELLTLKGHLMVEMALRHLLALRLGVPEGDLPRLTFALLSKLALAGLPRASNSALQRRVSILNGIRNDVAHQLSPPSQEPRIRELVSLSAPEREWPDDPIARGEAYRGAIQDVLGFINGTAVGIARTSARLRALDRKAPDQASTHPKGTGTKH